MENRIVTSNKYKGKKNILYLMRRDHRIFDNHALNFAMEIGTKNKSKIYIGVSPIKYNSRQARLIIQGVEEMKKDGIKYNIPIQILVDLYDFVSKYDIDTVITDYSPLREYLEADAKLEDSFNSKKISFYICDAHNLVPCKLLEKYKRTSKAVKTDLYKLFPKYCLDCQPLVKYKFNDPKEVELINSEPTTMKGQPLAEEGELMFKGGYKAGMASFEKFVSEKSANYPTERNNPDKDALSNMSQYLHLGHISAQKIIFLFYERIDDSEIFLNEIFVWRETAEHFCLKEENYDNVRGGLGWAQDSISAHEPDKREHIYTLEELENAQTGDQLWNAAQIEMVKTGKMHGYARMYWAKQIMKWSQNVDEALERAIYLNDFYSSDGNDPNGYLGIMWSICGTMDRAFQERDIVGKIRPMNEFKANAYISKWTKQ